MSITAFPKAQEALIPGQVAAKAAADAARELGLTGRDLARTIGVSEATVSRMKDGSHTLDGKPLELALCLIRVFRSLDAIAGGETAVVKGWMTNPNSDLGGVPRDLMRQATGLIDLMNYLDAQRAPV